MAEDCDTCPFYINLSLHDRAIDGENNENEEPFAFPSTLSTSSPSLEELTFRRVVTVEKECLFPTIDLVFIRGHPTCDNESESSSHNGTYARLDDVTRPASGKSSSLGSFNDRERGYLLFAFKSMEDLHSANFLSQWKAWTGAKYLYHMLPARLHIDFMAFFKKVSGGLDFEFLMVAHVPNLLIEAAAALNLLHYMRQKVCAHIAAYKVAPFELTDGLARKLHISRDFCSNVTTTCMRLVYSNNTATLSFPGEASISVSRKNSDANGNSFTEETKGGERRNSLTRTISIYDFPSIDESNERAFSSCLRPLLILPSIVHPSTLPMHSLMIGAASPSPFLVAPVHSATAPWSYGSHHRQERRHLTALPLSLLMAHPEIRRGGRRPILVTPPESTRSPILPCPPSPPPEIKVVQAVKKAATRVERKIAEDNVLLTAEDDDDERFRRLREAYFNSPDYDRSERPPPEEMKGIRKEEGEEKEEKKKQEGPRAPSTSQSSPTQSVPISLPKHKQGRKSI